MLMNRISKHIGSENWVMFQNGTIVSLNEADNTSHDNSIEIINEYGPVITGTPAGDFLPPTVLDEVGEDWLISYPISDQIYNLVRIQGGTQNAQDIEELSVNIGLIGRTNRAKDSESPVVIYDHSEFERVKGKHN